MTPGIANIIPHERDLENQIEGQIGCVAGFLQFFGRHQILAGRRLSSPKRPPVSPSAGSPSMSLPSGCSPENYRLKSEAVRLPLPLPLPVAEVKDGLNSSWKLREAPRLSLDSRAIVDANGTLHPRDLRPAPAAFPGKSYCSESRDDRDKRRRTPSVVARLMGLELLPSAGDGDGDPPSRRSELRRSASESRVNRELDLNFKFQNPTQISSGELCPHRKQRTPDLRPRCPKSDSPQRKSFFDSQEFFPGPKRSAPLYGEIEKRLRMRGIEEPTTDLETLKQVLEALQLKGLLHNKQPDFQPTSRSDFIYRQCSGISSTVKESSIVLKKSLPKQIPLPPRSVSPRRPTSPNPGPMMDTQRQKVKICRNLCSHGDVSRSPSRSPARQRPLDFQRQMATQSRRQIPAVYSSMNSPRRPKPDSVGPISPINRKPKAELAEDDSPPCISDASIASSPSQFDIERMEMGQKTGRRLLERCDKLLHSIAAITFSSEQVAAVDQQPSPVSVLDSAFLSDEPLPVGSVDLKDQLAVCWVESEDHWNPKEALSVGSKSGDGPVAEIGGDQDDDYAYVAAILRESNRRGATACNFSAFQRFHDTTGSSKAPTLHHQLLHDTVIEILERKRQFSPWNSFSNSRCSSPSGGGGSSQLLDVWEEMQGIREPATVGTQDVIEVTCGVIRKDMAPTASGEQEWAAVAQMSEVILNIERLLFKDLVSDTIRELANLAGRRRSSALPRRKLVF
ncbi:Protein LONGIFOLIA 2 [Apostasia shenzhenica]|uniref:Protein LONGIFOLIA 2 n=1 Tax=Apostasia shenzhenica TaxID=1088818 RepID=A0A2I0A1H1_9ASPA|nr:Protein LONGIFOLIA 2 [Apostasia shenzhenica]